MTDLTTAPPRAGDWPDLATLAAELRDARRVADPRSVQAGRMTEAQADTRARVIDAVAAIWSDVIAHRNVADPETRWIDTAGAQGATHCEILDDLTTAADRARKDADFDPTNPAKRDRSQLLAALAWWHTPAAPGGITPRILFIHETNQQLRATAQAARDTQQRKAA